MIKPGHKMRFLDALDDTFKNQREKIIKAVTTLNKDANARTAAEVVA